MGHSRHSAVYPRALLQQLGDMHPLVCQVQGVPAQVQMAVDPLLLPALQQFLPSALGPSAAQHMSSWCAPGLHDGEAAGFYCTLMSWCTDPAAGEEVGPVARAAAVGHGFDALAPRPVRAGAEDVGLRGGPGRELHGVEAGRVHCPHGHAGRQLLPQILRASSGVITAATVSWHHASCAANSP